MSREFNIEEKIYQGLLLLTAHKKFVCDVEKMREDHGIDWITGDEEKRFNDYYFKGGYETMDGPYKSNMFTYGHDDIEDVDFEKRKFIYRKDPVIEAYYDDLRKLMQKYGLTKEYEDVFDVYVQHGFVLGDVSMVGPYFDVPEFDKERGCYLVMVYPNTTKKNYEDSWKIAQSFIDHKYKRLTRLKKSIGSLERDVQITQMKNLGMKANVIANIINEKFNLEGDKKLMYDDINLIAHRTRERIHKFLAHDEV